VAIRNLKRMVHNLRSRWFRAVAAEDHAAHRRGHEQACLADVCMPAAVIEPRCQREMLPIKRPT